MRHLPQALAVFILFILFAVPRELPAQSTGGVPSSTKSGVYSREQAIRGQDVYAGNCKNCHTPESHTGAMFHSKWKGRTLSELYVYIRDQMPKNDPGTLSPQENADVLAYLLRMNRMPAGDTDLPADSAALKSIRIDTMTIPVRKDP